MLLGILFALPAFGQGSRVGDDRPVQSVQTPGGPIFSVPNATINICNNPANGVPCTNKANTYTDITLATQCPTSTQVVLAGTSNCVGTSDQYGNWGAWVPSGTYSYTITIPNGNSIGPFILTASSGSGSSILPTNNTFTGTNNFTNGIFISGNIVAATTGSFTIGDCVAPSQQLHCCSTMQARAALAVRAQLLLARNISYSRSQIPAPPLQPKVWAA